LIFTILKVYVACKYICWSWFELILRSRNRRNRNKFCKKKILFLRR